MVFIIVCLLFSSSRSFLNVSFIFSILFPRFWIIFTIITLNSLPGSLPISSSFIWSCGFLFCSLTVRYFSVFSFCVIYSFWWLLSLGYMVVVPLASLLCPRWYGWSSVLCRLPDRRDCCLHSGGWGWVFSLWWAGPCQVVCFGVSVSLVWL